MITASQLKQLSPRLIESEAAVWASELNKAMPVFEINTPKRIQPFIATLMHESWGLTKFEENLNYRADRLLEVFKRYFPAHINVNAYARNPQKIANRVYANRMGNGSESSGDGWRYRGRCPIQATGKEMYEAIGKACFGDHKLLVNNPDLLLKPEYGAPAACWIWKMKGCNQYADLGNFELVTKAINGGLNGFTDRCLWLNKCKKIFI